MVLISTGLIYTGPLQRLHLYWSKGLLVAPFFQGTIGRQGVSGPKGNQGEQGEPGYNGTDGQSGMTGAPGMTGPRGPEGDAGPDGENGTAGSRGVPGRMGPPGTDGLDGIPGTGVCVHGACVKRFDHDLQWNPSPNSRLLLYRNHVAFQICMLL